MLLHCAAGTQGSIERTSMAGALREEEGQLTNELIG